MGRKVLRSLDLFSGIGGLTLALQGVAEPSAYCDIDPAAQAVLADRIARRLLPDAPVCNDVRHLTPAWLRAHKVREAPKAILAGFLVSASAWWASGKASKMSRAACSWKFCGSWTSTRA